MDDIGAAEFFVALGEICDAFDETDDGHHERAGSGKAKTGSDHRANYRHRQHNDSRLLIPQYELVNTQCS